MRSRIAGLFALWSAAILLGGCEEPLAPEEAATTLASRAGPNGSNDLQTTAASPSRIDLYWLDNSSNETGWEVHRSPSGSDGTFALVATTAANATSYSNTGLSATTRYCYKVRSFRSVNRKSYAAFSNVSCAITLGPPEAPVSVIAIPWPYGRVTIGWSTNSFTTEGFRLERAASDAGPWVLVALTSSSVRFHEEYGRGSEQPVCYRVIGFNSFGDSPPSVPDCTTPPAAPTELTAKSAGAQAVDLTWKDNSGAEDGYEVQRAEAGIYLVWNSIATVPASAAEYHDNGLPLDQRFWYRVRATRDGGYTEFTPEVSGITASAPPGAPSGTTARPSNSSAAELYWIAATGSLADSFRVERRLEGGSWVTAGHARETAFLDPGLRSEVRVCYQVFAINRLGTSPASQEDCTTPPAAPTNLRTIPVDDQVYEVRWDDNSSVEEGYILWLYEGFYEWYYPVELPANTTSLQISTSTYVDVLAASSDGGYSDWVYLYSGEGATTLQGRAATRRPRSIFTQSDPRSFLRKGAGR